MTALLPSQVDGQGARSSGRRPARTAALWLSEAIVGGLLLLVALLAWVSLVLADLGGHALAPVVGISAAVVGVGTAVGVVLTRRAGRAGRVRVRTDVVGLGLTGALAVLAAVMFFPGFPYGAADKDPGGYVAQAMSIARTGDYAFPDPASDPARVPHVELESDGARFPGVWLRPDGVVVPQFYALWPALMATAYDIGGQRALFGTAPLCGVLAVCALALVVRRAVSAALGGGARAPGAGSGRALAAVRGWPAAATRGLARRHEAAGLLAGAVAGALLATNMLEVWQAKYPTTEISAQLFFVGALLGVVIALVTGWWPAAAGAGLVAGVGFLDRADGLLPLLLAAALGAGLLAVRRFDGRAAAFAAGLGVVLPHALWQAYSPAANRGYTLTNGIPDLPVVAAVVAALFGLGLLVRRSAGPPAAAASPAPGTPVRAGPGVGVDTSAGRVRRSVRTAAGSWARPLVRILGLPARPGRSQRVVGALVVVAATALLALGALRPRLFGADYAVFGDQGVQRTYDEQSLTRLSWFLSWPAFLLALVGLAVVALRRWNAALWTVVLPPLLLLPVYAWHTRNSTRLMWWARRYVPVVLPGLLALVAVAVGVALVALLAHRWSARLAVGLPALAVTAGLLAFALPQSLPLRHHAEMAGSFEVTAELAALSGAADGVYLWPRQPCCLTETGLFPGALWLGRGQLSALLPADQAAWGGYIRSFEHGFPDSPLFVIGSGTARPEIPGLATVAARHIVTALPYWQESDTTRPDHEVSIPVDFTVWRVQGT